MRAQPNIDHLILAGDAAAAGKPKADKPGPAKPAARKRAPPRAAPPAPAAPELRKQMVIMLPVRVINDIKIRAWMDSLDATSRVTQQMVVETALRNYLYK